MNLFLKPLLIASLIFVSVSCGDSDNSNATLDNSGNSSLQQAQSSSGTSDCEGSTRENPKDGEQVFSCGDWEFSLGPVNDIPTGIFRENAPTYPTPTAGEKFVGLKINAKFIGEGSAELDDVFSFYGPGGLTGALNKRYEAASICCSSSDGIVGKQWSDAAEPFKGGTVSGWAFFLVDKSDSDFVLGLDLDTTDEVMLWVRPSDAGSATTGVASEFQVIDELVIAFVQAGGRCDNPTPNREVVGKYVASVTCESGSLTLFSSTEDLELWLEQGLLEIKRMSELLDIDIASAVSPFLLGPNWAISTSEADELQERLGGRIQSAS